jgi:hypothetical protein
MRESFKMKWAFKFDMKRIPPVHPFEIGNGGCNNSYAKEVQYIGKDSNGFYFNATVYCDNNYNEINKLILKVIIVNGRYKIDNVMTQKKYDYFKM